MLLGAAWSGARAARNVGLFPVSPRDITHSLGTVQSKARASSGYTTAEATINPSFRLTSCIVLPFTSWLCVSFHRISTKVFKPLQYSDRYDISADENGFVEFRQPIEPFELPRNVPGMWSYKSSTDLYEFKKVCLRLMMLRSLDNSSPPGEIDTYVYHPFP